MELARFADPRLGDLADVVADVLGDHVLGHEETLLRLGIDRPAGMDWAEALTEVLAARYIDDVQPTAIPDPASAIDRVVNNLDYIRSATPEAARRLDRVRDALAQAFGPGTDLELLSLDSQGYGSFGEANGFAVLDPARGQVLIALSGYAE